jgi:hypothetical protein
MKVSRENFKATSLSLCHWVDGLRSSAPHIAMFRKLKRLRLNQLVRSDLDDVTYSLMVAGCPLLENLELRFADITDATVRAMAQRHPHLRSLSLFTCENIRDISLIAVAESCPHLEVLHLHSAGITDTSLCIAAQQLPHLRSLSLTYCENITDISLVTVAESCPQLEVLNLGHTQPTDKALFALVSARCRETITFLSFHGCRHITDAGVRHIVTQLSGLRALNISYCSLLTKDLFDEATWKDSRLAELRASSIEVGSPGLFCISTLPSLEMLDLSEAHGDISEAAIMSLAKLRNLKYLDLSFSTVVGDNSIKIIAGNCSLTELLVLDTNVSRTCLSELRHLYPNMQIETCITE